jgi:Xaa-Pro dipeptidase
MKDRLRRIFQELSPAPDAVLLANATDPHLDHSFFYLFDAPSGLFEGSVAVGTADGELTVLSSPLEEESARQAQRRDPNVQVEVFQGKSEREATLRRLVPERGTVGLNYQELTTEWYLTLGKMFPSVTWKDASAAIQAARSVKDTTEVARIERAAQLSSRVANEIPSMLRAGMTELELAAEMEYRMMQYGSGGRSFQTIVGFGSHSAEPHYAPGSTKLEPGSSIVCDFGAISDRYCSDITRSFRFGPRDPELKRVHETVFEAQRAALEVLKPGVTGQFVHQAAQAVVDASPWKGRFNHGLGHALGLSVHDGGAGLGPISEQPLKPGMVVTVEPGIYLPGHGGVRIEDDVVITEGGYRFLTTARREYVEVSA